MKASLPPAPMPPLEELEELEELPPVDELDELEELEELQPPLPVELHPSDVQSDKSMSEELEELEELVTVHPDPEAMSMGEDITEAAKPRVTARSRCIFILLTRRFG